VSVIGLRRLSACRVPSAE